MDGDRESYDTLDKEVLPVAVKVTVLVNLFIQNCIYSK